MFSNDDITLSSCIWNKKQWRLFFNLFFNCKRKAIGISKPIAKYTKYAKSVRRFHRASANLTRPLIGELSFDLIDNVLTGLTYINRGATAVTVLGEGKPGAIGALTIEYTQDYLLDYAANYIGSSSKPDEINNIFTTNEKPVENERGDTRTELL